MSSAPLSSNLSAIGEPIWPSPINPMAILLLLQHRRCNEARLYYVQDLGDMLNLRNGVKNAYHADPCVKKFSAASR